jgi:acetyl esterase/lipase
MGFDAEDLSPSEVAMAITFQCEGCGKSFTIREELAGKTGQCKQCGLRMTIPSIGVDDAYGLDEAHTEAAPLPPRSPVPSPAPARRPLFDPPGQGSKAKKGFLSFGKSEKGGLATGVIVVVLLAIRGYNRWERAQRPPAQPAWNQPAAPGAGQPNFDARSWAPDNRPEGPIALPNFPDLPPGREIEPGVTLHEVVLGPPDDRIASPPGHGGKLWVYLPSGEHAARSLPCILIAGAGSNLISGMDLGDGDRPEHLPYVHAGFAVVAFELDGVLKDRENPTELAIRTAGFKFRKARAGLVNAHIALEYAMARVPEVDPGRISSAGHSSAGTLSLLFAENEPRLRSSVAFAPVPDIEASFGPQATAALRQAGLGDFVGRYSPNNNEAKLDRPLFLFYAKDDPQAGQLDAFAGRLKAAGKPITVETVPTGGHYQPMIRQGIPEAIAWLKEQDRGGDGR